MVVCQDLTDLGILSAIKEIRRFSNVPLIVADEGEDEMAVVQAMESGADDYIRLPCGLMEVMARVVALMRRVGLAQQYADGSPIHCGNLLINPGTYEVFLGSTRIPLTPTEFRLLHLLAKNRHMTVSQDLIQRVVWSDDVEAGSAVKTYIRRLRRKLGDDPRNPMWIKTIHGIGYRFVAPVSYSNGRVSTTEGTGEAPNQPLEPTEVIYRARESKL